MTSPSVFDVLATMQAQRDLMCALQAELAATVTRVSDSEYTVVVEVNAAGALTGLWLGRQAYRNGPSALANAILDAARSAAQIAFDRQNQLGQQFHQRLSDVQRRGAGPGGL